MDRETLIISTIEGKNIKVDDKTLLVFIDETGEKLFNDNKYPIFGLGGCVIPSKNYKNLIDDPWKKLRKLILGDKNKNLHASDLIPSKMDKNHLLALGDFFSKSLFKRIAIVATVNTKKEEDIEVYQLVASILSKRITEIYLRNQKLNTVLLVFEESQRDSLVNKYFREIDFQNHGMKVDVIKGISPKGVFTGLEIADFIMHAAGTQVRERNKGNNNFRKDFQSVFKNCDSKLSFFMEVTKASFSKSEN